MGNRALILYLSNTGNTEKVAFRFQKVFEKFGWECDLFKVDKNTDTKHPAYDLTKYDFLCVGSPVIGGLPHQGIIDILFNDPNGAHWHGSDGKRNEERDEISRTTGWTQMIVPGPKKGIVFVTYSGNHFGPPEAEPALSVLALEMEHLIYFKCIGKFSCPGLMKHSKNYDVKIPTAKPGVWYSDGVRPNERDLIKAEIFMEEILEGWEKYWKSISCGV